MSLVWCDRCGDCQPSAWRCRHCQVILPHWRDFHRGFLRDLVVAIAIGGFLGLGVRTTLEFVPGTRS
jgi:hypothetical protein